MRLFEHVFSIGAIMKNEGDYLQEWLDYHLAAGVDHFYLYDNGSMDSTRQVLTPYIQRGIVDYKYWPGEVQQMPAYNDMVSKYRFDTEYLCFLDCDEFLLPLHGEKLPYLTRSLLEQDPKAAGLVVNWRMFGPSGWEQKPNGGVLKNFVYRSADNYEKNEHIKTIANPRKIDTVGNPHFAFYFDNGYAINEDGDKVEGPFNKMGQERSRICINHYFTKSREEWRIRRSRRRADTGEIRSDQEFENPHFNAVYDAGIIDYWEKQKKDAGEIYLSNDELAELSVTDILKGVIDAAEQGSVPDVTTLLTLRYRCYRKAVLSPYPLEQIDEVILSLIEIQIKNRNITMGEFQLLSSLYDEKNIDEKAFQTWLLIPMYQMACWWRRYYWQKNDGLRLLYCTRMRDILRQHIKNTPPDDKDLFPTMDIIIPVHDMPERLKACLQSVYRNTTMPYRLIIVDDASRDAQTIKYLHELLESPRTEMLQELIVVHNDKQLGMEASIMRGWEYTQNHVVCLHADVELPYGWLERLTYPLFNEKKIAAVLPLSNRGSGANFPKWDLENNGVTQNSLDEVNQIFVEQGGNFYVVQRCSGPCIAINREYLQSTQDADWLNVLTDSLYIWHKKEHMNKGSYWESLALWQLRDMLKKKEWLEGNEISR